MWRIHLICVYLWKYQCKFPIPKWAVGSIGVNKNDFIEYVFAEEKENGYHEYGIHGRMTFICALLLDKE